MGFNSAFKGLTQLKETVWESREGLIWLKTRISGWRL